MSKEVKAIFAYTPRVKMGKVVETDELVSFIAGRSSLNEGAIVNLLFEFRDSLMHFAMIGRPVRLKNLGILAPRISKDGKYGLTFKIDSQLKKKMNVPKKFKGNVLNHDMLGKSVQEMKDRWNQEHPEDPV